MVGRPLEVVGAPEAVRPEPDPGVVVALDEPPAAVEDVLDDPVPEEVSPDEVVAVAPAVVEVDAVVEDVVVAAVVKVVEEVEDVVALPADTAGLPDPCTATPTTPATRTAVIRPPRARRGATGADLPSQTTLNF